LKVRSDAEIPSGSIPGLNKKVSRLVMGVDNQDRMPHAAVVFDDFFEKGGNTFDTGWVYGATRSKLLGQWVKTRGVREQVNLIVKGAHTPECNPKALTRQLLGSLKLLQTDYADIYMMHRDNLDIPVGEFVDVLNEHARAGRIKIFGGSNWSIERVEAANAYAKKKGLQGFNVLSNNFSLARMVNPVWPGCVAASDPQSKAWLTVHKDEIALLPWSSQARGFFVPGVASPDKKDDAEMVDAWYSPDNFERQRRAFEMAKEKGVAPINIALAYVLCQPFPIFPLIGPRKLSETRTSLPALEIHLTEKEMNWLDLGE
jgi:aryl-alcohol dehydrogenase-like predicted oxidoreductase